MKSKIINLRSSSQVKFLSYSTVNVHDNQRKKRLLYEAMTFELYRLRVQNFQRWFYDKLLPLTDQISKGTLSLIFQIHALVNKICFHVNQKLLIER